MAWGSTTSGHELEQKWCPRSGAARAAVTGAGTVMSHDGLWILPSSHWALCVKWRNIGSAKGPHTCPSLIKSGKKLLKNLVIDFFHLSSSHDARFFN